MSFLERFDSQPSLLPLTGFPSPAETHWEAPLDLNRQLIMNPAATFVVRAGRSWPRLGISAGDLLLIDRALEPYPPRIVLGIEDGRFCLARLCQGGGGWAFEIGSGSRQELQVWGVVTCVLRQCL